MSALRMLLPLLLAAIAWTQSALFPPEQLDRIRQGIRNIYNLEYEEAVQIFESMSRDAPGDPAGPTYLAMTWWLKELNARQELSIDRFAAPDFFAESPKYVAAVEPAAEERIRDACRQAIDRARSRLAANPQDRTARYLLGVAYQHLASFEYSLKRNWWRSFRYGIKTYRYHQELLKRDPALYDCLLATGVYNWASASMNIGAKVVGFFLGYPGGSKERGKSELWQAAEKAAVSGDEARIMLTLIYARERDYQRAYEIFAGLLEKYPRNCLLQLNMAGLALQMKKPDTAIEQYQDALHKSEDQRPGFGAMEKSSLYNRLGVAYRQKGDLTTALAWFARVLADENRSQRSTAVARLELGKTFDLLGRRENAREQYQAVLALPDIAGSLAEAQGLLRRPYRAP